VGLGPGTFCLVASTSCLLPLSFYFGANAAQVGTASATDVTLILEIGWSLMSSPFTTTVLSARVGSLNSPTPISRNESLPSGAVFGISAAGGALAMLTAGSVAATSIQVSAARCRRQPVTETMSTLSTFFFPGCPTASAANTRTSPRPQTKDVRMGPV
jgi:hypothetical protein